MSGDRAERQREAQRRYRAANRDKRNEQRRRYWAANRDRISEYQRRYWAANRDRIIQWGRRYRHGLWPDQRQARWDAQDGRCYLCGDPLPDDPSEVRLDHDHRCHPLWPAGTRSK